MATYLQRNLLNFYFMFVLIWTSQVECTGLPLPNSGLTELKNLWKSMENIGHLPASSQKMLLRLIGQEYLEQNITQCNVFGGMQSCISISGHPNYIKSCKSENKSVDCIFQTDLVQTSFGDPFIVLQQYGGEKDHIDCAHCHENFEKFLCAVTAPPCGTVDKVLDEIPFLISSVSSKKFSTRISLQKAVPHIIQAASLGFPCKTMCEAMMESCGCEKQPTFGEVMDTIVSGSQLSAMKTMGLSRKELFHLIWDRHVCDIFSEESVPGFSGACVSLDRTTKCDLCNAVQRTSSIQKEVVKKGVFHLSQLVLRMLQGGLQETLLAIDNPKMVNWHVGQAMLPSNQRKRGRHIGAVVLVVVFVALVIFVFVASIRLSRNREVAYQYVDLSSMGYTPPML